MIKVLGRPRSINVRKVLWTLDELDVAYTHEPQWGADTLKTEEYRALNPNQKIPVLKDGDFVLWESNAICRYLVQTYGPTPLWPEDRQARAITDQWMSWQSTDLHSAYGYAFGALVRQFAGFDNPDLIQKSVAAWNTAMTLLDERLGQTGGFVCGEAFSLADVMIGLCVHRWRESPIERTELPQVERYISHLLARPAAQSYLSPETP